GIVLLCSCVHTDTQSDEVAPTTADLIAKAAADPAPQKPLQLPVRYQHTGFITANDTQVDEGLVDDQDYVIKVGANIRSIRGPQPLWDIMKRLASLKGMSVSWSSDVDQNVRVDVDISANDDYFKAIDNMLRQVDYFHEVKGSTIIIKYKETKTYHVAMPFTHQVYETATGGNVLGSADDTSSTEGTIRLDSRENEFDIWKNIQENLDAIIATWQTSETTSCPSAAAQQPAGDGTVETSTPAVTRQVSAVGNSYTIDKPVGLITVNAPRPLQEKINAYLENIKEELYKQVTIEAKIIEVQLDNSSTLGIDWNLLLDSLSFGGSLSLGQNYDKTRDDETSSSSSWESLITDTSSSTGTKSFDGTDYTNSSSTTSTSDSTLTTAASAASTAATIITGGASNAAEGLLTLASFNFADFLHALSEQGTTSILANPKLSVMNGQPALITVGRNVTYVESIDSDVTSGNTVTTNYTANTERILSGVGLALTPVIKNNGQIIMTIVPVTSVLEEPIEYRQVGLGEVGLPIINIREMSTMVQVNDGEMLVIGGLISTTESTSGENLFPGLADVPVLKYLTGYETKVQQKRELIILLRPRIL
ncbi:MAG: hypothetical protein DSY80_07480, partial [Desulfocapsa sp.]